VCPVDCIYVDDEYQSTGQDMWDLVRSNEQIPR
jgi:electron transport complex protein RnfB